MLAAEEIRESVFVGGSLLAYVLNEFLWNRPCSSGQRQVSFLFRQSEHRGLASSHFLCFRLQLRHPVRFLAEDISHER